MRVEEVDARTAQDDVLARFHALELACHDELAPGEPARGHDEAIAFLRHQPTSHTSCHWLADVGCASLYVHGPTAAFVHVVVDPARRRHGIGSALLRRVLGRCSELGVTALHGRYASETGAAFAGTHGFVDGQRILRSLLDLHVAELPEPRPPDDWRLATWLGRVPDDRLAAYARARAAMDDAPDPEGMESPTSTAETVRASEDALARRRREMNRRHRDGRGHRGKGLARAVKLASLRRLRGDHPEIDVVSTLNAEENAVMRRLNESLGFRPTVVQTLATLRL